MPDEAIIGDMAVTKNEHETRKRQNLWPMMAMFLVYFLIWMAISLALYALLVVVFHVRIAPVGGYAFACGVGGLLFNAAHWLARRKPLPGKPPAQVAAEEFFSGRREPD